MNRSLIPGQNGLFFGGDWYPEQWMARPEIVDEDIRLLKQAHCNEVRLGFWLWPVIEPQEGVYDFDWLDGVIDRLEDAGIGLVLSTPSASPPGWMRRLYPETVRILSDRQPADHGAHHNYCQSSPVYRQHVATIDGRVDLEPYGVAVLQRVV